MDVHNARNVGNARHICQEKGKQKSRYIAKMPKYSKARRRNFSLVKSNTWIKQTKKNCANQLIVSVKAYFAGKDYFHNTMLLDWMSKKCAHLTERENLKKKKQNREKK